jgi:hypothetical protein
MAESYDEAYRRGKEESQGIRNPAPPPKNDSVKQGYEIGKSAGKKSGQ